MLLLAVDGELDTAFVLPGIFSDHHPAPSASPDAFYVSFSDGAVSEALSIDVVNVWTLIETNPLV